MRKTARSWGTFARKREAWIRFASAAMQGLSESWEFPCERERRDESMCHLVSRASSLADEMLLELEGRFDDVEGEHYPVAAPSERIEKRADERRMKGEEEQPGAPFLD